MKQLRLALIHNGTSASEAYANTLNEQLNDEAVVVNVQDPRPIRLALPVRAVPNVAVILFANTLEEQHEVETVLQQLHYIKNQDGVESVVDKLIAAADPLDSALADEVIATFFGGDAV